jgi:uncharacterized protein (TIGR03435 family)
MHDAGDMELLREYERQGSEEAFAALVQRHVNLVYSAALRHVGIGAHAEEITQAVFILLARKAAGLRPDTILEGWLYETTRLTALSFLRGERRRKFREQEAYMQSTLQESADASTWNQLAPLLDEAMARLGKKDRDAVVLRFFKDKNLREVAAALKVNETAAQRRVHRAVEKLRRFFTKRGIVLPAAVLTAAISANSVQAAPVALAKSVTAVAIAKGAAASGSTLTLIKGALKIMAWSKTKTVIVLGIGVLLAIGTTTLGVKKYKAHQIALNLWRISNLYFHPDALSQALPQVRIVPTKFRAPVYGGTWVPPNKWAEVRAPVVDIVAGAYGCSLGRVIFPAGEPKERYDFAVTLPHGAAKALQQEIKKTLGLVGRRETNDTDVLALKVRNQNSQGLKPYVQGPTKEFFDIRGQIICIGQPISSLTENLEVFLRMPVVDETGLTGKYNFDFKWFKNGNQASDPNAMKQVLLDQLGLELVPTNMPIEMLVVEKVK